MNIKLLEKAKNSLVIQDIYLRSTHVDIADGFDPKAPEYESLDVQFRQGAKGTQQLEVLSEDESDNKFEVLKVEFEAAFRFIPPGLVESDTPPEEINNQVLINVVANFIAEYRVIGDLDDDAIREFSVFNVGYHVWPYWREYAQEIAHRIRAPQVIMPLYNIPKKSPVDDSGEG